MALPRLLTEAFRYPEGEQTHGPAMSLGNFDLTDSAARAIGNHPKHLERWRRNEVYVSEIAGDVSDAHRDAAYAGDIGFPNLPVDLEAFLGVVGGISALPSLLKVLQRINTLRFQREHVIDLKRMVTEAEIVPAIDCDTVYHPLCAREFAEDVASLQDDWCFDRWFKDHPRPRNEAEVPAWEAAYSAFCREHEPSFVFLTRPEYWQGVRPEEVREDVENDPEGFDVWNLIENSLSEFHEDAGSEIKDAEALEAIISGWLPEAGTGSPADLALDTQLAAWNAKQSIHCYYADTTRMFVVEGKTRDDAAAWCDREISRIDAKMATLEEEWTPQASVADEEEDDWP
jgi:hypothetical protein